MQAAVVAGEDDERIVSQAKRVDGGDELADRFVEGLNHGRVGRVECLVEFRDSFWSFC